MRLHIREGCCKRLQLQVICRAYRHICRVPSPCLLEVLARPFVVCVRSSGWMCPGMSAAPRRYWSAWPDPGLGGGANPAGMAGGGLMAVA